MLGLTVDVARNKPQEPMSAAAALTAHRPNRWTGPLRVIIDQVEQHKPGGEFLLGSESEDGRAAVMFDDDGETGYFYACQHINGPILDALLVYNVGAVVDRDRPSEFKIGWSALGRQAVLLINGYPHAVFDFDQQRGWCRRGFPPPPSNNAWSRDGHAWDESCLQLFA